jgi:putative two-component system response regulator
VSDAVRARTLYRQNLSHEDTVDFIVAGKHTHFDPSVVDAFLSVSAPFKAVSDEALADSQ